MVKTIKLKDGRTLAYEEFGDPNGKPFFYFHGWPASRITGKHYDEITKKNKIRLICPDRPGFGLSTFKPYRKLLDWPNDVCELADRLGFKKFSVIGSSGGGPYVSVCAYKIPNRLTSAGVIAGLGPLKIKDRGGLNLRQYLYLRTASILRKLSIPSLLLMKLSLDHFGSPYRKYGQLFHAGQDGRISRTPEFKRIAGQSSKEAFRQGILGPYEDLKIYSADWGFKLKDIKIKVFLWHGMLDRNAPFWMGKYVASQIPKCKATFWSDQGHFLLCSRGEEILSKL
jgi:pimeloyl-ACP methyl ester carboxylesterase